MVNQTSNNMQTFNNIKVLIAEDDPVIQQQLVGWLSKYPQPTFQIMCAPNGKVAFELAVSQQPDIILMDWEMPVMTGMEALEKIQTSEETKHIPVIMVTALSYADDLNYALSQGAADYLVKPFEKLALVARIKSALQRHQEYQKMKAAISSLQAQINNLKKQ